MIYDLQFLVSSGQNVGSISSITAFERTIFGDDTYSDGPLLTRTGAQIDWDLNTDGTTLHLDRLAFPGQKKHGIVGPPNGNTGEYDNANSSITGGTHNPFFGQTATFLLNVPGVTGDSTIDSVTFSFNTSPGFTVPGNKISPVPEPTSCALSAISVLAVAGVVCRRKRAGRGAR